MRTHHDESQAWVAAERMLVEQGLDPEAAARAVASERQVKPLVVEPPRDVEALAVTLAAFVAVDEEGAEALLGDGDNILIPEAGGVMFYGDGGAGKTTLTLDMGFHMAAGDPWLGIPIRRQSRILLVENEGPRALFRKKLRRKLAGWKGSPIGDRIIVLEEPWASLRFDRHADQDALAGVISTCEIDVVIIGPVTAAGMFEAGTIAQVRAFADLIGQVAELSGRVVTFVLIHHENKGGAVSGAWEGVGETLVHVSMLGRGHTRLFFQKARWSSAHHGTTLKLAWSEGDSFELEEAPEVDEEQVADQILAAIREHPGRGWGGVEKATPGVQAAKRRTIRDGLLGRGLIVNVGKAEDGSEVLLDHLPERRPSHLYLSSDPTIQHLRPEPDAGRTQAASLWPDGDISASASCVPALKGRRNVDADPTGPDEVAS